MKENKRRVGIFSINSIVFRFDPVQRRVLSFDWVTTSIFLKKNQNDVVLVKKN